MTATDCRNSHTLTEDEKVIAEVSEYHRELIGIMKDYGLTWTDVDRVLTDAGLTRKEVDLPDQHPERRRQKWRSIDD